MWTSLSYLVDNLSEIYKKECKGSKSGCDFIGTKNNKLNCKRKSCKKRWLKPVNELIKNLPNIHKFCNSEINTFVLLLRKGVYPYKYMDSQERFDETSLPDKEAFYNELNLESITDDD